MYTWVARGPPEEAVHNLNNLGNGAGRVNPRRFTFNSWHKGECA